MGEHNRYGKNPLTVNYVAVFLSREAFTEFFIKTGRLIECTRGLPEDAKLIQIGYAPNRKEYVVTFEHPSFDPIPIGQPLPEFVVEYTAYLKKPEEEAPSEVAMDENTAPVQH
jgi:hypothetical protein